MSGRLSERVGFLALNLPNWIMFTLFKSLLLVKRLWRTVRFGRLVVIGTLDAHPEAFDGLTGSCPFALDGWVWCSGCERAYSVGSLLVLSDRTRRIVRFRCPVSGCTCSGGLFPWDTLCWPRGKNPDYPPRPADFAWYPLRGFSSSERPACPSPILDCSGRQVAICGRPVVPEDGGVLQCRWHARIARSKGASKERSAS